MNKVAPCKDCPDRYPACHDHCDRYQAWKAEREKIRAAEAALNNRDVIEYEKARRRMLKKIAKG